jgi:hypothetical protein
MKETTETTETTGTAETNATNEVPKASSQQGACSTRGCICGGKGPAVSEMLRLMMPSDSAGEHFRNGAVEFLKGLRDLLDQRIQMMSETPTKKGTKLNVE